MAERPPADQASRPDPPGLEPTQPLERLAAATSRLAANVAVTEQLAASRAELLRTANATLGVGRRRGAGRVFTLAEAAQRSGRHPEVLRRWCLEGRIPATRLGRSWTISEDTLAMLMSHRSRA